jgi:hypothetical protein
MQRRLQCPKVDAFQIVQEKLKTLYEFYKFKNIGSGDLYCSPSIIFTPVPSVFIAVLKTSKLFDS